MNKLTCALAVALMTVLTTSTAQADTADDNFVRDAQKVGVSGAPADLITNGRAVCSALDSGNTPDTVRDALVTQLHLQRNTAGLFIAEAAADYCPQHGNLKFQTGS